MNINIFQWRYSPFLLLGFGVFGVQPANAQVLCDTPSMTNLTFGNVDPQSSQTDASATFTMNCRNSNRSATRAATICLSIGQPRQMTSGSNSLNFQLYQDASRTNIWGSQFAGASPSALQFEVLLNGGASNILFTKTLYGRVLSGQTDVIPGAYNQSYPDNNNARVTIEAPLSSNTPGYCNSNPTGSLYFPFTVSATIPKICKVTTTGALDLGSVISGSTPTIASSSADLINVTCTKSTPYNIGLSPSNGNVEGMGVMKNSTATDTVPYQLRSTAGIAGKIWGNTATSTTLGNGVAGIGSGTSKGETVFATVANTDVKPDTYSDTVTVHVNY